MTYYEKYKYSYSNQRNTLLGTAKNIRTLIVLIFCSFFAFFVTPSVTQQVDSVCGTSFSEASSAHAESGWVDTDAWGSNKLWYDRSHTMWTTWFWIDGHVAYCCQPSNGTPWSGSYWKNYWYNNMAAAILYFGYGGPGWDYARNNGWWPSYNADGGWMSNGDYYVATHVMISYVYGSDAYHGASWYYRQWANNNLFSWVWNNLANNAWRVPEQFKQNVYWMDPGWNTPRGWQGQDIVSYNWVDAGGIQINKKESRTNRNLSGIRFGIYRSDQWGNWGSRIGSITTDWAGNASTRENELTTGWYRLWEDNPPSGCDAIASDAIYVTDNFSYAHYTAKNGNINWNKDWGRVQLYNFVYTSLSVNKSWDVINKQDSVEMLLLKNGTEIDRCELNKTNSWYHNWTRLPKYDENGNTINYSVKENGDTNGIITIGDYAYQATYKKTGISIAVSNKQVKDLTVTKEWTDFNDKYGFRPKSIKINLIGSWSEYIDGKWQINKKDFGTITLTEQNGWKYTWKNIPVCNKGNLITYKATEISDSLSDIVYYDTWNYHENNKTIKITNIPFNNVLCTTKVAINKEWIGTRTKPSGIILVLKNRSGAECARATVAPNGNNWSYTFNDLPRFDKNGILEQYTVSEEPVSGYKNYIKKEKSTNTLTSFTIKNISTETRDVQVTKKWIDNTGKGTQPSSITVELYKNGASTGQTLILNNDNNWTGAFTKLDKYDDLGNLISWSIMEQIVSGYSYVISGTQDTGFTITNSYGVTEIEANKIWNDNNNAKSLRPSSITIRLLADGKSTGKTLVLSENNSWKGKFTNLPKYNKSGNDIDYTITEDDIGFYSQSIKKNSSVSFTVTNICTEGKTSVALSKVWDDNNNKALMRPNSVNFKMYKSIYKENISTSPYYNKTAPQIYIPDKTINVRDYDIMFRSTDSSGKVKVPGFYLGQVQKGSNGKYSLKSFVQNNLSTNVYGYNATGVLDVDISKTGTNTTYDLFWNDYFTIKMPPTTSEDYCSALGTQFRKELKYKKAYNMSFYEGTQGFLVPSFVSCIKSGNNYEGSFGYEYIVNTNNTAQSFTNISKTLVKPTSIKVKTKEDLIAPRSSWSETPETPIVINGKNLSGTVTHQLITLKDSGIQYIPGGESSYISFYYSNPKTEKINIYGTFADNGTLKNNNPIEYASGLASHEIVLGSFTAKKGTHYYKVKITNPINSTVEVGTVDSNGVLYNVINDKASSSGTGTSSSISTAKQTVTSKWPSGSNGYGIFYAFRNSTGDIVNNSVTRFCTYSSSTPESKTLYKDVTLSKNNDFKTQFDMLDKFSTNNALIEYTFEEDTPDNYVSTIVADAGSGLDSFSYTATNKLGTLVDIPVTKLWDDNDNLLGHRPESITVTLYNETDNCTTGKTLELNENNGWSGIFYDLPYRNSSGTIIKYTLQEDNKPDYYKVSSITNNSDGSITITNSLPTVTIPVTKVWNDENNEAGKRPADVTMALYYTLNGNKVDTGQRLILNESNSWNGSFSNLLANDASGNAYAYSVEEASVDGYTSSLASDTSSGTLSYTFTNKIKERDISVSKVWAVDSQSLGNIPDSINAILYADGVKKQTIALNTANNWAYTFTGLPFYNSSGKKITYTIDEEPVSGYVKSISGDAKNGFVITNAKKIDIPVSKIWNDDDNHDGIRPSSIGVSLTKNGVDTGKSVTLNASNGWKASFTNLDTVDSNGDDITYSVKEENVSGYVTQINGDASSGFTIVNTHENTTTDLKIVKGWDDQQDIDKRRPTSISVKIYSDGTYYKTVTLNASDNWEKTLNRVPKTSSTTGRDIVYTVSEDTVSGYTIENNAITGNVNDGWTITLVNYHEPEKMSIPVRKRWYNADGRTLPASITVTLMQDGKDYKSMTLTSAKAENGEWIGEFSDVPIYKPSSSTKYSYSIKENVAGISGYSCQIGGDAEHGFVLTNVYTESSISVNGVKQWQGDEAKDRPSSITVRLLRNGTMIGSQQVKPDANGQWEFKFDGLPVADDAGSIYNYTVEEEPIAGYRAEYGFLNNTGTYRITNKKMLEIPVKKIWNDNNNANGSRPKSITARLYAWRYTNSSVLSRNADGLYPFTASVANDDFTGIITFDGSVKTATIKVLDANGKVIRNVSVSAGGDSKSHSVNIGTISSPETKFAVYGSDGKLLDATHIASFLIRDDTRTKEQVASKELNAELNWTSKFEDLTEYDNKGFPLEYFVEEDPIYGYKSAVSGDKSNGFTLTNTEQTEIPVKKEWLDKTGKSITGTANAKIILMQNGKKYKELTLTKANNYSGSFKNMPWRDASGNEYAYEIAEDTIGGWQLFNIDGNVTDGFKVTNIATTQLKVTKQWINDTSVNRPSSLNISLSRNISLDKAYDTSNISDLSGAITDYSQRLNGEMNYGIPTGIIAKINVKSLDNRTSARVAIMNGTDLIYETKSELSVGNNEFSLPISGITTNMKELRVIVGNITDDDTAIDDLYAGGKLSIKLETIWNTDINTLTLNASNSWNGTFNNLVARDSYGAVFTYDAKESTVPNGYSVTYNRVSDTELTIKNSYSKVNVPVKKVWNDQNNADGTRPSSVTIELLKNGTATGKTITLNEANEWSGSFNELDSKTGNTTNTYTVRENSVPSGYTVSITGNQSAGFTVTNTHAGKTSIAVTKVWDDQNNLGKKRPKDITIHLFANGSEIDSKNVVDDGNGNWNVVFDNLDYATDSGQVIKYTVSETSVTGYRLQGITGSQDDGYTITNWTAAPVKLPETGKSGLVLLILFGISVILAVITLKMKTTKIIQK